MTTESRGIGNSGFSGLKYKDWHLLKLRGHNYDLGRWNFDDNINFSKLSKNSKVKIFDAIHK